MFADSNSKLQWSPGASRLEVFPQKRKVQTKMLCCSTPCLLADGNLKSKLMVVQPWRPSGLHPGAPVLALCRKAGVGSERGLVSRLTTLRPVSINCMGLPVSPRDPMAMLRKPEIYMSAVCPR